MRKRRARGELEAAVLAELWAAEEPLSTEQVRVKLGGDLAYTTVLTALSRLYDKGALARTEAGRGYVYSPVLAEADLVARRMRSLLDNETDREDVLSSFVASLDPESERILRRALKLESEK